MIFFSTNPNLKKRLAGGMVWGIIFYKMTNNPNLIFWGEGGMGLGDGKCMYMNKCFK